MRSHLLLLFVSPLLLLFLLSADRLLYSVINIYAPLYTLEVAGLQCMAR